MCWKARIYLMVIVDDLSTFLLDRADCDMHDEGRGKRGCGGVR